jgi:hypothetical protein
MKRRLNEWKMIIQEMKNLSEYNIKILHEINMNQNSS